MVNDLSVAKNASLGFGVLNYTADKQFDKRAEGIALPASGKGRIYVPTTSLTVSMEGGNAIALNNIAGYYFMLEGEYKEGFEIRITNIGAYSGTTNAVPDAPGILNVTEGVSYQAGIIPEWTDGVAVLDGKAYVFGTPITVNGPHNLQVGTGKNFTEVNFEIYGGTDPELPPEPPVDYKKGDMDGDGEITVSDALKVLRIAAKLAEPTAEDYLIGDIDGDGEITVSDALKVLRVAAKLADEDSL